MLQNSYVEQLTMTPAADAQVSGLLGGAIVFSTGLLGFANCRRFSLSRFEPADGHASPFLVLSSLDQELSFVVIQPKFVAADYTVPCFAELLQSLGADSAAELLTLLIVTVRDRIEDITVNLQGPLVVSTRSHVGIQLVLEDFPLRHPLVFPPNP
jgi:flagellar assembly factor FliW